MINLLRLEQTIFFALSVWFFSLFTDLVWWIYPVLFLLPDVAFLGYLVNPKVGAVCYNLTHHQGLWSVIALTGFIVNLEWLLGVGIIFVGHSAFDRILGYGLKYNDGFKNTHLGVIGTTEE